MINKKTCLMSFGFVLQNAFLNLKYKNILLYFNILNN